MEGMRSEADWLRRKLEWDQHNAVVVAERARLVDAGLLPPEESGLAPSEMHRLGVHLVYHLELAAHVLSVPHDRLYDAVIDGHVQAIPFYDMILIPLSELEGYACRNCTPTAPPALGGWQDIATDERVRLIAEHARSVLAGINDPRQLEVTREELDRQHALANVWLSAT